MKMNERYRVLRSEIDSALKSAELDGVPFDQAIRDLFRLTLILHTGVYGARRTETLIANHIAHMRRTWPELHKADAAFPPTEGSA